MSVQALRAAQKRLERYEGQADLARRDRDQAIVALAQSGASYKTIAELSGLSLPMIGKIMRGAGVRRYRPRQRAG